VEVHDIGGSHFSLVGKENAGRLAETIREIVEARLSFGDV
jgi:thioesterase domain-containing protein